jgi:hypothetical protein
MTDEAVFRSRIGPARDAANDVGSQAGNARRHAVNAL